MPPASGGGRVGAPFQAPIQCHSVAFNAIQCHSMAPFIALPPWIPGPGSSRANQPRNGARRNSSELNPATEGPKRSSKSWLGGGARADVERHWQVATATLGSQGAQRLWQRGAHASGVTRHVLARPAGPGRCECAQRKRNKTHSNSHLTLPDIA